MVTGRYPNHVWHIDLTTVPISQGFWVSWLPFGLPQRWPFCWWVALVVDHYTRRIMGFAVFERQPTAAAVRTFVAKAIQRAKARPRHLVSDHGVQFCNKDFRAWSRQRGIGQRFGAVGQFGSIAVIERLIRTVKDECTRRMLVPFSMNAIRRELALFCTWYNDERPHAWLAGATPDEIYRGVMPSCAEPRFEPRERWPRHSPCAAPQAKVRGRCGARLDLHVTYLAGRKHLPLVQLRRAA